jgi:hypothetical protein
MPSIHNNPWKYAEIAACSLEIAQKRCKYFLSLRQETEKAMICPVCGKPALLIKAAEDEEWFISEQRVMCASCDFESSITERFEPLQYEFGFDSILFFRYHKEMFNMPWDEVVARDTAVLFNDDVSKCFPS